VCKYVQPLKANNNSHYFIIKCKSIDMSHAGDTTCKTHIPRVQHFIVDKGLRPEHIILQYTCIQYPYIHVCSLSRWHNSQCT